MKNGGIWDRLLLKRIFSNVLLFLICFFFLYILIDYSSRISGIPTMRHSPILLLRYYGSVFVKRLEVLLPFALMLGTIRSFQVLYREKGFVAALGSGTRLNRLLRPFYLIGFSALALLLANEQWFIPHALKEINTIESLHFYGKGIGEIHQKLAVQTEDGGRLFFSRIEPYERTLREVYYLPSWNQMVHMETLDLSKAIPEGQFVDFFQQTSKGWELQTRQTTANFPKLSIAWEELFGLVAQPNQLPITVLIDKVQNEVVSPLEMSEMTTTLTKKLLFPILPLIVIIALIPYGVSFSRTASFSAIYGGGLFLFLILYLSLSALQVAASPPLLAVPFILLIFTVFGRQMIFLRKV